MKKRDDKPAALDHVLYEMQMLTHAAMAVCNPALSTQEGSAWLEVFAIHARNLNEFFDSKERAGGFMRPDHFGPWIFTYTFNREIDTRASQQVAHLTYSRERPEDKVPWPIAHIFRTIRVPSLEFLNMAQKDPALMAYNDNRARTLDLLYSMPRLNILDPAEVKVASDANVAPPQMLSGWLTDITTTPSELTRPSDRN